MSRTTVYLLLFLFLTDPFSISEARDCDSLNRNCLSGGKTDQAPLFQLPPLDNKAKWIYLIDFLKQGPVILFFLNESCGEYCKQGMRRFIKLRREKKGKRLQVLFIFTFNRENRLSLAEASDIAKNYLSRQPEYVRNYPYILLDSRDYQRRAYGVLGVPDLFYISPSSQGRKILKRTRGREGVLEMEKFLED